MHKVLALLCILIIPFLNACEEEQAHAEATPSATASDVESAEPETRSPSSLADVREQNSVPVEEESSTSVKQSVANGSDDAPLAGTAIDTAGKTSGEAPSATPRRLPPITYHKGSNHAHVHRRGSGYGSPASQRQHKWLRSIGANSIAITPFGFQRGATSNELVGFGPDDEPGTRDRSMRLEDMAAEVQSAHEHGLRVMLKPHIWSHDFWDGQEWHGTIRQDSPDDHRRWWQSYRKMILYYAEFAEQNGVEYFCIGTELAQITTRYPDEWRELIADVRRVFGGELTYAAHWDREWREIAFWDRLDFIGLGAYFPLKLPDTATTTQLVQAWQPYRASIDSTAKRFNRPVIFLECGYRPVAGTWREPWLYEGGKQDPEAQGRAFDALFRAFEHDSWFHGLYVWKSFTDDAVAFRSGEQTGFLYKGLPGEEILRRWWK